jgi:Asp/Glu/hydantoin racemase
MRILVINPNTTEEMTEDIGRQAAGNARLCLGCAGVGPLDKTVEAELGIPVLDGVACGVKLIDGLVDYRLATSRVAAFRPPEPKEIVGSGDRELGDRVLGVH